MAIVKAKNWNKCTIQEKKDRWLNAERVLKGLPKHVREEHWNMRHWGIETECGTVCCAAGHCGLDPWFNKRGFVLKPVTIKQLIELNTVNPSVAVESVSGLEGILGRSLSPGQGGFENSVSIIDFFGVWGEKIFGNPRTRTVDEVIVEIRARNARFVTDIKVANKNRLHRIKLANEEMKNATKDAAATLKSDLKKVESYFKNDLENVYR